MKLGILGTENSHAMCFAELIKNDPDFADVELVGIYGYSEKANAAIMATGICGGVAKTPDELLGKVDAIAVTARHGDHHYEYAMPYVRAGVPAFIDKPFAVDLAKASELAETAEKYGALLCGGSCLKHVREWKTLREYAEANGVASGAVCAPISMVNDYGGFYFYSQHLIEMLFPIFGTDVKAVQAYCPDPEKNRLTVVFDYGDYDVCGQYSPSYCYSAAVRSSKGVLSLEAGDITYAFKDELMELTTMVKTGQMPQSYHRLVQPVILLHAIEDSFRSGRVQNVIL